MNGLKIGYVEDSKMTNYGPFRSQSPLKMFWEEDDALDPIPVTNPSAVPITEDSASLLRNINQLYQDIANTPQPIHTKSLEGVDWKVGEKELKDKERSNAFWNAGAKLADLIAGPSMADKAEMQMFGGFNPGNGPQISDWMQSITDKEYNNTRANLSDRIKMQMQANKDANLAEQDKYRAIIQPKLEQLKGLDARYKAAEQLRKELKQDQNDKKSFDASQHHRSEMRRDRKTGLAQSLTKNVASHVVKFEKDVMPTLDTLELMGRMENTLGDSFEKAYANKDSPFWKVKGIYDKPIMKLTDPRAADFARQMQGYINAVLKATAGTAVSEQEFNRVYAALGVTSGAEALNVINKSQVTVHQITLALSEAKQALARRYNNKREAYSVMGGEYRKGIDMFHNEAFGNKALPKDITKRMSDSLEFQDPTKKTLRPKKSMSFRDYLEQRNKGN